jgi:nicotinate-nucleotide adenylyltransferase
MKTIALFGGSFDPPHIGHKAVVEAVLKLKEIDGVVVMPTFLNPFKNSSYAPPNLRLKWLKKIFLDKKNVKVSSYEVDKNEKIPTIKTVRYLLQKYTKIYLVIGADNLCSLHKWKDFNELKQLVYIVVATRDNLPIDDMFLRLDINEGISSSKLRQNIDISKLPKECAKEIEKFYKEYNAR